MPLDAIFETELHRVYPGQTIGQVRDPTYGENEYSVQGFVVTAGSDTALAHGAAEMLYRLGFYYVTPLASHQVIPAANFPAGLVGADAIAKRQNAFAFCNTLEAYGRGGQHEAATTRWEVLNNWGDRRRPNGHVWEGIIDGVDIEDGFFLANPDFVIRHGALRTGVRAFNCYTTASPDPYGFYPSLSAVQRAAMVARIAAYMAANSVTNNRASFECGDGDGYATDHVCGLLNEVAEDLATTRNLPDIELGLYAYAGHRTPPSFPVPRAYVQVATGFNKVGFDTYADLMAAWDVMVGGDMGVRNYEQVAAWQGYLINRSALNRAYFVDDYVDYRAVTANQINAETGHNNVKNVIGKWAMMRHAVDGVTTYADALDELLGVLFNDDPKVRELFEFWGSDADWNAADIVKAGACIAAMQPAPYKTEFQDYWTVYGYMAYDIRPDHGPACDFPNDSLDAVNDLYWVKLEKMMERAWALGANGRAHANGLARRIAGYGNTTSNGRSDLDTGGNPHWQRYPVAPTPAEFTAGLAALKKLTYRPPELKWQSTDDLMVVATAPQGLAAGYNGNRFEVAEGDAKMIGVGPITVTVVTANGTEVFDLPAGITEFSVSSAVVTYTGAGFLCQSLYPSSRLDGNTAPQSDGHHFLYAFDFSAGQFECTSAVRLTLYDRDKRMDITAVSPTDIVPGVLRSDGNTRGTHHVSGLNEFVSCRSDRTVMTKAAFARQNKASGATRTTVTPAAA